MFLQYKTIILMLYLVVIYLFYIFVDLIILSDYIKTLFYNEHSTKCFEFDYIIVGAGSAGSIMARRLSEDKTAKILLLEAGSHVPEMFDIPPMGLMLQGSSFDWKYKTTPQKNACLGLENQVNSWPMGKLMGGSSRLNNLIYVRGHPNDFDSWYKNDPNFDYTKDILPYFKKLEEDTVFVNDLPFYSLVSDAMISAGESLGFLETDGIIAEPGFARPKVTMVNGKRWTSSHNLYKTKKSNLVIRTNAIVEKVLLKSNYEASGVVYKKFGKKYTVRSKKAVILSAGTIGSPKILLLSGIGPKNHLNAMKIPLKLNLPVGDNLQDHLTSGIDLVLLNTTLNVGIEQMFSITALYQYFAEGKGPWTTVGCENIAFVSTQGGHIPDLQLMTLPLGVASDRGAFLAGLARIGPNLVENYFNRINQTSISILPLVLHPKSRGSVRLKSANPDDLPEIDPNYLAHEDDLKIMLRGVDFIKKVVRTRAMRELGATLNRLAFPGCERFVFDSEAYWECYLRRLSITCYHPVGTCGMGRVVDHGFRVLGTNGLYVVDGSSLAELPSGNPNAVIMMMAEKAADLVKLHDFLARHACGIMEVFLISEMCAL